MEIIYLRLLLIGSCIHHSVQQDSAIGPWCDSKFECNGQKHTMCEYKEDKDKGDCKGIVSTMDDIARERLLGLHNYVRNYMAAGNVPGWPEAANMRQITWDDECAEVALRWAFQCDEGHDNCRITDTFKNVGQNYGMIGAVDTFDDAVYKIYKNWLSEIVDAPSKIVKKFVFKPKYGHFSQLVWAETYKMGCCRINFTTTNVGFTSYKNVIVCNYGPGGNVEGQPMWEYGPVGSQCGGGSRTDDNSTYRNLCSLPTDPSNEAPVPIEIPSGERSGFEFTSVTFLASALLAIF